jgi:aldehyde dehydrogenase (NAD+)
MLITNELFVGGQWVNGSSRQWLNVVSPITEELMGRVVVPTYREADRAVAAATDAFVDGPWRHLSVAERAAFLRQAMTIFEEKHLETAVAMQIDEVGTPQAFARSSATALTDLLEQAIDDAAGLTCTETRRSAAGPIRVLREPLGVCAAIISWSNPLMAAATKLFAPLLMGCSVVLKTSPQSPFSAYLLAQAMSDAGLPPGVLSILPGGRDTGAYLISHAQIDTVSFTGRTDTGRQIASVCGDQLKSITCELGGKSAAILVPGIDVNTHLRSVLDHALSNNGQLPSATTRLLVHTSQVAELRDALIDALSTMAIGDPHDPSTSFGPLVNDRQRDRVEGYIASGIAQGATLAYGGTRPAYLPVGYYLVPAVFTDVDNDMAIATDDIFGPVLSIIGYSTEAEAVQLANDSRHGFGGSVYADDPEHALHLATALRTGTCAINDALLAGGAPFSGYGASGLGCERGPEGLYRYLRLRSITLPASMPMAGG